MTEIGKKIPRDSILRCCSCKELLNDYDAHIECCKLFGWDKTVGNLSGFICSECIIKQSGIEKLYHVSKEINKIEEFIPRIPEERATDEDARTPRVCLTPTIDGCLTAIPWGERILSYVLDVKQPIRVYEFDIKDLDIEHLIPPECLYSEDLVIDSRVTKEYWYTIPVKPSRTYLIELDTFFERVCDYISCEDVLAGLYTEKDNDTIFDWKSVINGSFVEIYGATYRIVGE